MSTLERSRVSIILTTDNGTDHEIGLDWVREHENATQAKFRIAAMAGVRADRIRLLTTGD